MTRRAHSAFLAIAGLIIMAGFMLTGPLALYTSPLHLLGALGGLGIFALAGADLYASK